MKEPCTSYFKHSHVPKINTPDAFSLEKYIKNDSSIEKAKAAAWGAGNFKELIKINVQKNGEDTRQQKGRPRTVNNPIGRRINELLIKNNKTAMAVANDLQMSTTTFTLIMCEPSRCRRKTFERIAHYFGVSVDWILSGKE